MKLRMTDYTNTLKPCRECKWFSRGGDDGNTCTNVLYRKFDVVDGWYAQQARTVREAEEMCGTTGEGWEPRVEKPGYFGYIFGGIFVLLIVAWVAKAYIP